METEKINKFIRETSGIPGGVEEELLTKFYKKNGRLPGELWTPVHTIILYLFAIGGIGLVVGLVLEGLGI